MKHRLAVHSISWGSEVGIDDLAKQVSSVGYSGIELFQDPRLVGGPARVFEALNTHGLELVGICGGTFQERVNFVKEYRDILWARTKSPQPPYIYLDERIDANVIRCLKSGFRVALHPHMYKSVQTLKEAEECLAKHRELLLVPDTAHMYIAGDDAADAIRRYPHRLAAIHLKNWKRVVGVSFQFYGRGFCELDEGDIDLEAILSASLTPLRNGVWLVVEHDRPRDPLTSARNSFAWVASKLRTGESATTRPMKP